MKAIIVGRHELSGDEGLEVIEQKNINFPATSRECKPILNGLIQQAFDKGVALVFQAIPGQVNVCLPKLILDGVGPAVGIIINKPEENRPAGAEMLTEYSQTVEGVVRFVNPRAKIKMEGRDNMRIIVDPPMRFEFSHIEWF